MSRSRFIPGSVVRTTHLTGMVTDLGINLSTVITAPLELRHPVYRRIILRLVIFLLLLLFPATART